MTSINDISMAITFDEAEVMGAFKLAELRAVALTRLLLALEMSQKRVARGG